MIEGSQGGALPQDGAGHRIHPRSNLGGVLCLEFVLACRNLPTGLIDPQMRLQDHENHLLKRAR